VYFGSVLNKAVVFYQSPIVTKFPCPLEISEFLSLILFVRIILSDRISDYRHNLFYFLFDLDFYFYL